MPTATPLVSPELRDALKRLRLGRIAETLPDRLTLADKQEMAFDELLLMILTDEIARRDAAAADNRATEAGLDKAMRLELSTQGDDVQVPALADSPGGATHRQSAGPGVGRLLPVGQREPRSSIRPMADRADSPALRKPTAPETKRRPHLDHVERERNLWRVEAFPRLPCAPAQRVQAATRIGPLTDSTGNAGWRKSPCLV
jgi:hypothetical protein